MFTNSSSPSRRQRVRATAMGIAVAGAASLFPGVPAAAVTSEAIRPFRINVPEDDLRDLRRRIAATRWPDKETVADQSQGAQLAKLQELVRYWGSGYDWRKVEAKLNALPQFMTNIDGVDIHFIHVRSRHQNALPVIITHGWPGSVIEQLKIIGPLTDPDRARRPRRGRLRRRHPVACRATASPASRPAPVGTPTASREPGRS